MTAAVRKKYKCVDCSKEVYRFRSCEKPCPVCNGKMKLKKLRNNHIWNNDEDNFIRKYYEVKPYAEIAKMMGMTKNQVAQRINFLGLRLTPEVFNQRMYKSRFQKGQTAWNKGMKGYIGANCTSFKKGRLPHNTKHVGAITIRSDKNGLMYKWICLALGNWIELHRHNWIQEHGPIPKGHVVRFKDGDTLNPDPKNLELITRAEHLKRNKPSDLYTDPNKYRQSDKYFAGLLVGKDTDLKKELIKNNPELIELKRAQLKLKRSTNAARQT